MSRVTQQTSPPSPTELAPVTQACNPNLLGG
jgi:hypothetical protein